MGCRPSGSQSRVDSPGKSSQPSALRILVLDDPDFARAMERQWTADGESRLTIRQLTEDEFSRQEQRRLASDVVIYPSALLGELAARDWLQPLAEKDLNDPAFQRRDIWELTRLHETNWGGRTIAVPFGSPTLVLCYRSDIFDRLGLSLPRTWSEYREVAERLSDRKIVEDEGPSPQTPWFGTCEPLGKNWAAEILLARAAPYARHRSQFSTLFDYSNMRPLIDGPPFVRALEELADAAKFLPPDASQMDAAAVRQKVRDGDCALAITWPSAADAPKTGGAPPPLAVRFAPLPGSRDVYNFRTAAWEQRGTDENLIVPLLGISGRLGSITKECRHPTTALNLLFFLSGPELSGQIGPANKHMTLFRESHISQADKWVDPQFGHDSAQRYAEVMKQVLNEPTCLTTLRIPGRQRYMSVLAEAVRETTAGEKSAQEVLKGVAGQWDEITNSLGRDAQRRAYVQSIGLEP